ncbi:recombinase RecA [Paraburkholderia dipogonis]|uniref:recombinase RecA n=1 Tax=Paraburkholderia dipogonis TaxID=1211383 RepID=UPI0038BAF5AD
MSSATVTAEEIHPSLWRASQLARGRSRVVETGYPALSAEPPGGGWPVGALIDLMVQQAGVGELSLLRPALSAAGNRPVPFVRAPHTPDGLGPSYIGLPIDQVLRVKAQKTADALWSAEQILRAGSCCALIFWTQYAQASSLRRLHLVAQSFSMTRTGLTTSIPTSEQDSYLLRPDVRHVVQSWFDAENDNAALNSHFL